MTAGKGEGERGRQTGMHAGRGRGKEGGVGKKEGDERERGWAGGRKEEGRTERGREVRREGGREGGSF